MKLQVWDTPFAETLFPGVAVAPDAECSNCVSVVVSPSGIDQYPKYILRFEPFGAYRCDDESLASIESFNTVARSGSASTYKWEGSPWLEQFVKDSGGLANSYHGKPLEHFVILGGDLNVDVLAPNPPTVEVVNEPRVLCEYRV